jgi:hypothetical protein
MVLGVLTPPTGQNNPGTVRLLLYAFTEPNAAANPALPLTFDQVFA